MNPTRATWPTTGLTVNVALVRLLPLLSVLMLLGAAEPADDDEPDQWLAAETGIYIQINDLAHWRQSLAREPVVRQMLSMLPRPPGQTAWIRVQQSLQMSGEQIIDRYFGRRLVLIAPKPGWGQPVTIMLRVKPDDAQVLIERLTLQPVEHEGALKVLTTPDRSTHFAMDRQWIGIARAAQEIGLQHAMARVTRARSLAHDPAYRRWVDRLPAQRSALAFFRAPDGGHAGALAVVDHRETLSIHYVGRPPGIDEVFRQMGSAKALELGPLPRDTLAAVMVNLRERHQHESELIDRLLAPKTYEHDVLPRIDAPLVLFAGQVPPNQNEPDAGAALPVIGLAVKLRDVAVADELTAMADKAVLVASVSNDDQSTPLLRTQAGAHRGVRYHWAHIGPVLAKRWGRPELAPMTLTYGRIGQWYVVCTHDWFFRRCIDADADRQQRLTADPTFAAMPLRDVDDPVATVMLRAPAAAVHLRAWLEHFHAAADGDEHWQRLEARLAAAVTVLDGYQSVTAQFHKAPDLALVGRLDLVRKEEGVRGQGSGVSGNEE